MKTQAQIKKVLAIAILTVMAPLAALSQNRTLVVNQGQQASILQPEKANKVQDPKALALIDILKSKTPIINPDRKDGPFEIKLNLDKKSSQGGTGVDGGGGNLRSGTPLKKEVLKNYLSVPTLTEYRVSVHKILKYLFNSYAQGLTLLEKPVEVSFKDEEFRNLHNKIIKKLIEGVDNVTIYSALRKATIKLQDEACLDPKTGEAKDASADRQANLICLSWDRLSAKLFTDTFESYLIPLLAHEYSHLVGTTEEEAEALEDFLKSRVSFDKISRRITDLEDQITNYTSQIPGALNELQKAALARKSNTVCIRAFQLYSLQIPADNYFYTIEGFFPFNAEEESRVHTLWTRLLNLTKYCEHVKMSEILEGSTEPDDLVSIDYAFQMGGREMTVLNFKDKIREFYFSKGIGDHKLTNDQIKFLSREGTISQVSNGDLQAILSEVNKITSLVMWLRTETDVFEYPQLRP